jgi:hypothetical protein
MVNRNLPALAQAEIFAGRSLNGGFFCPRARRRAVA